MSNVYFAHTYGLKVHWEIIAEEIQDYHSVITEIIICLQTNFVEVPFLEVNLMIW